MLCPGYISFFVFLFILNKQVLGQCPQNCASCSKSDDVQICNECNNGYWLRHNFCLICPDNCKQCTNNINCTKCKSEFWDIRPNMACDTPCKETCTSSGCYDTTGFCFGCNPGFYGRYCDRSCDLCIDRSCNQQRCMIGCINGYYESTDNGFECKQCNTYCSSCVSFTNCTQCERGYYLFSYEQSNISICLPCYPLCEECISYSECVCVPGKYGPDCSKDCNISNCKRCIEDDSVVKCTECINGYTFRNGNCILETNLCSQYCSNGCDSNQNCLAGCQDGWTGQKCTEKCPDQCKICDQSNTKTCKMCKEDFYTNTCTLPCGLHCSTLSGLPRCNMNNGTCINGCDKGYWDVKCDKRCFEGCNSESCSLSDGFCDICSRTHYGHACQNKCSEHCLDNNASSNICYKTNGACVHGCKDGYGGNTCEDELTVSATVSLSTEKFGGQYDENGKSDSFAKIFLLGILTGVGFCLLSLVAFVAVRRIRRRKQSNGNQIVREERPYVNTAVTMQAVSSTVTECNTKNVGSKKTSDETSRRVYDSLDGDRRDDRHLYSGLERQTDHQSTSYANL